MAEIPLLGGPQVRTAPRRAVVPSTNAALDTARTLGTIAGELGEVTQAYARRTERRVTDAAARLAADYDAETATFLQRQGFDAEEGLQGFRDRLSAARGKVEATLTNEDERALFRREWDREERQTLLRAESHAADQRERADDANVDALNQRDVDEAARRGRSGMAVDDVLAAMDERLALHADRKGWGPDTTARARQELRSAGLAAHLNALVETGDPGLLQQAKELLTARGDQLTEAVRDKVTAIVGEASERATIVQSAGRILTQLAKNPDQSAEDLLQSVPLEIRPDVRKYVKGELDARKAERQQVYDASFMGSVNRVEAARRAGDQRPPRMIVGPGVWDTLDLSDRNALDRIGKGEAAKNDDAAWMQFYLLPPEALRGLSEAEFTSTYWSKLDSDHRDRALTRWQAAAKPESRGASGYFSETQRVRRTFQTMFEQPVDDAAWDDALFTRYEDAVDRAKLEASTAKGNKPLTDTEFRDLTARVATEMLTSPEAVAEGTWGEAFRQFSGRAAWSLSDQYGVPREAVVPEKPLVPFDAIPLALRDSITTQLREQGRAATERRVQRAFTALQLGDTVGYNAEVGVPINPEIVNALRAYHFPRPQAPAPKKAP